MTVLDDAHLLAQIVSRGNMMAQYGLLSISPYGPGQQQADLLGWMSLPPPSSLVLDSGASSISDLADGQVSASASATSSPVYSSVHSACSSPTFPWAAGAQKFASPAAAQEVSSPAARPAKPTAQRSLSAALSITIPAASAAAKAPASAPAAAAVPQDSGDGDECSTPRAHMIPAVLPPPGAPRAPRPTARLLVPTGGRRKLQQWLADMELSLTVPASPAAPCMEDCPAPKVGTARTAYRPGALRASTGRLSTPSSSAERASLPPRSPSSFAAQLSSSSSGSSSNTGCRKRALPALGALSLPGGCASPTASGDSTGPILPAACNTADTCVRSSKRRSPNGSTCGAAGRLPAPAFDILGLLSANVPQERL